jgi:hypothetical protein
MPARLQPARRDLLWPDQPGRSHTPAHIAPSRTIPSRDRVRQPLAFQPHAGRREPAAADPGGGDPVWLEYLKGQNVFLFPENAFSL